MTRTIAALAFLLLASTAGAEEIICKGNIFSIQGEGLIARKHRFEVSGMTGSSIAEVLEKGRRIARERQQRAARKSPGGDFRRTSDIELDCTQGSEKLEVRRTLQTGH